MWKLVTDLVGYIFETETSPGAPPPPIVFQRHGRLPHLFEFNKEKLDINLLIYPDSGRYADRDALLLLVYGCEEVLGLDAANEAYVCRKLGTARDKSGSLDASFDAVFAATRRFDAQELTEACVRNGDLERLSRVAGGDIRLSTAAKLCVAEMAYDLNRRA